jgi:hypothetical protein
VVGRLDSTTSKLVIFSNIGLFKKTDLKNIFFYFAQLKIELISKPIFMKEKAKVE